MEEDKVEEIEDESKQDLIRQFHTTNITEVRTAMEELRGYHQLIITKDR